ncbi:helix-turn-helix transcriptional regulator [Actinacidiphila bryophytorum]|uniref:HTH hxlR-type domain-containing protein n=1 Tax=Actinacidiphila bryophytorum TaxID=1436133 RepID=A0A9W4MB63_9ACTN|nr:helix-turn-helix transcriptional regulator [Actinacidiphila bryophytorum]MBM9436927.1 helix-turn-helix transcriptional regulator [Actinacidiphila bryophytorum]CAG7645861.1 hypothetical protein SBRY_40261 [Actinacidiphila bryophytorum]
MGRTAVAPVVIRKAPSPPSCRRGRGSPPAQYTLTPLGRGLHEIVMQLIGWVCDHHDEIRANRYRAGTSSAR